MKPVRGLPALWRSGLQPERRMALAASAALFLLIGGMALYQTRLAPEPRADSSDRPAAQDVPDAVDATDAAAGLLAGDAPAASVARDATGAPGAANIPDVAGAADAAAPGPSPGSAPSDGEPPLTAEAEPAFSWPLSGRPRVVMPFGAVDASLGDYRLYDGLALEATPGQPVVAAAGGTVAAVEEHPVDGITVLLDHGDGRQSRYAGLAEAAVAEGEAVEAGARIGRIGLPAPLRSELGPHLLFALLVDDEPVDPLAYLDE